MEHSPAYQEALEQFVHLWGEMASAWGINKTMSQIHALLYAESHPLDTDTIMDTLDISRGNANMNLRRLLDWELIYKESFPGDRKDYYSAETDVWKIVSTIIRERQQREIASFGKTSSNVSQRLKPADLLMKKARNSRSVLKTIWSSWRCSNDSRRRFFLTSTKRI